MNRVVWSVILVHMLIYFAIAMLCSCGLFRKTTKEQQTYEQESNKTVVLDQLDLSKLYRETERYSFHPNGSIAAHEMEREQVAAATVSKRVQKEQQKEEVKYLKKTSSPVRLWILAGLLILLFLGYVFIRKLRLHKVIF